MTLATSGRGWTTLRPPATATNTIVTHGKGGRMKGLALQPSPLDAAAAAAATRLFGVAAGLQGSGDLDGWSSAMLVPAAAAAAILQEVTSGV